MNDWRILALTGRSEVCGPEWVVGLNVRRFCKWGRPQSALSKSEELPTLISYLDCFYKPNNNHSITTVEF